MRRAGAGGTLGRRAAVRARRCPVQGSGKALSRSFVWALVCGAALLGCATGTGEVVSKDSCKVRDCGPTTGGDADPLDEGILDEGVFDTGSPPPLDTGTPGDAAIDTGTGDSGCKPTDGAACSPVPQCGCGAGLNCDVTSVDGNASCVPAGLKTLGQPCKDLGECAKALTCVFGACQNPCVSTADCTKAGSSCLPVDYYDSATKTTKAIPGYRLCAAPCDPLAPSKVCGASVNCLFADATHTTCAGAGSGTGAGACSSTNPFSCAPGYLCLSTNECRRWCRIGFSADCPLGKSCGPLTDHPKLSGVEYGVCSA